MIKRDGRICVSMIILCIVIFMAKKGQADTYETASGDCTDYIDISTMPLPISVTGSTADATNDYGPYIEQPACWQGMFNSGLSGGGPDITYKWIAPADTSYSISLLNSEYDTGLEIYAFTCPTEPRYPEDFICGNDDFTNYRSKLTIYFEAGQTVLIVVDGYGEQMGNYRLDIEYILFPGENCNSYYDLSGMMPPISISGNTINAMNNFAIGSSTPPCWQGDFDSTCADGADIVYKWVAPYFADYGFRVEAIDSDPTLLLYEFTCPEEPVYPENFICGNDDYGNNVSYLDAISLTAGQEILIVVDGPAGSSGNYNLVVTMLSGGGERHVCPENTLYGQTACTVSDNTWEAILSDRHEGPAIVFDNIPNVQGTVTGIDFMGFDGLWENNMFIEADADSMAFWVQFYTNDNDGLPGQLLGSRAIIPEKIEVEQYYNMTLNHYRGGFDESFEIDGGWISIQGLSLEEPEDCVFLWLNSLDGDHLSYQGETRPTYPLNYSMNFCLIDSSLSSIADQIDDLPGEIALAQNYPNPFNSHTVIQFEMTRSSAITLDVFDIMGRKIATLIDDVMDSGQYDIPWNADKMVSGIYFYRITTDESQIIKKMILVK